jgi:DNA repair exonuclease SbcCD ATPase subunit
MTMMNDTITSHTYISSPQGDTCPFTPQNQFVATMAIQARTSRLQMFFDRIFVPTMLLSVSFTTAFQPTLNRPKVSTPNGAIGLQLSPKEDYDIERYRNRSALTESVLKEKVQEVRLLKVKVDILQNVVKTMQATQKHASGIAASTETELMAKLQAQEHQRDVLMKEMGALQQELIKAKSDIETQAQQHITLVQQLKSNFDKQRRDHQQQLSQQQQELSQLNQNKIKALQQEVFDLDQSLEKTQSEFKKLNRQLADREDDLRNIQRLNERKKEDFQQRLNETIMEKENAIKNQTLTEASRVESLEIASAAVNAAEKRELALQKQLNDLQAKHDTLLNQKNTVADVPNVDDGVLQRKVEDLQARLQSERVLGASRQKMDQQRFEAMLDAERAKYEEKLKKLQMQDIKRVGDTPVTNDRIGRLWSRIRSPFRRR